MELPESPPKSPPWSTTARWIVAISGAIGFIWLLVAALPLVEALAIAALLAYLLNPFVNMLMRRSRLNRTLAVMVIYTILLLIIASLPATLGALAFGQFQNFRVNLGQAIQEIQTWVSRPIFIMGFKLSSQSLVENINQAIGRAVTIIPGGSLGVLSGITTNLLWGLVIVISLYYFLKDGPKIKPWVVSLLPPEYKPDGSRLLDEIDDVWRVFLRVQILIFIILAILLLIGSFVVVLLYQAGLIPFSWIGLIVVLVIVYALIQQVDNLWLRPLWMGQRLRLHPGIVFVGLVGALALSGFLGAIIIVPMMASIKVIGGYVHCKLLGQPPWSEAEEPPVLDKPSQDEHASESSRTD
jgi:predicted PurR-regulated permease PerM